MAKQQEPLPPMKDEPNQAEIDRQQAEEFRRGAAEKNGKKYMTTFYQVEAKFKGWDWQRNLCHYKTLEAAEAFRKHFIKIAETRIVEVSESHGEKILAEMTVNLM